MATDNELVICSECFHDEGLRLDAQKIGVADATDCPACGKKNGAKLSKEGLDALAHRFFVWGSLFRFEYGAAPLIEFNEHQQTSIKVPKWLQSDLHLIENKLGVGFFEYGPPSWMIGQIAPLKALQDSSLSLTIIERVLGEYPTKNLNLSDSFYRLRKAPSTPSESSEYDSPPLRLTGNGRLDSNGFPVLYASPDIQVCIHECRVTAEDDLLVATLRVTSPLGALPNDSASNHSAFLFVYRTFAQAH